MSNLAHNSERAAAGRAWGDVLKAMGEAEYSSLLRSWADTSLSSCCSGTPGQAICKTGADGEEVSS